MNPIFEAAKRREDRVIKFLADIVRIPSPSGGEGAVIKRIGEEMTLVGFDEVRCDGLGNIIGRIGSGPKVIAMDAHVDTVDVNPNEEWVLPPFQGVVQDGNLFGRGAVDQKAGMAALVHAGGLIKELGLEDEYTLYIVGSVQEEDCDGLCWQYLVTEENLRPDCVVLTEPTSMRIHVGHRGRTEISVRTRGTAAHASAPERGVNAVYKMGRIVSEIEKLNRCLPVDPRLGKGSVAVTSIACETPSLCSVPDECVIRLDRRLNLIDSRESALAEVEDAVKRSGEAAEVFIDGYDKPSHRGLSYRQERYFPAWMLSESDPSVLAGQDAFSEVFEQSARLGTWVFSTNGVATKGRFGIPTIGLGPGDERYAHAVNERVPTAEVVAATAWYAAFPRHYVRRAGEEETKN